MPNLRYVPGGVISNELFMMDVVKVRPGPYWDKVVQAPGEIVPRVGVDGLEQAKHDPDVHGQDMQVACD